MADSDDWRVTISISYAQAGQAQQSFSLRQAGEDIRRQAGCGIVAGAGEAQILLYAGTETAAGDAERITRDVLAGYGMAAESALHRWHPVDERWQTPDVPMPQAKPGARQSTSGLWTRRPPSRWPRVSPSGRSCCLAASQKALDGKVQHCPPWIAARGPVLTFCLTSC